LEGHVRAGSNFHCSRTSGDFFNKVVYWKPFDYYTVLRCGVAGLEYYRTIRMDYDGNITRVYIDFSNPDKEAPEGVHEFLGTVLRRAYNGLGPAMQADSKGGIIAGLSDNTIR
jgi:hypothetical protein